jgi:hypothetical protein
MSTFCTCVDPPGATAPEYACLRIPCAVDAGSDAGPAVTVCPDGVRGGNLACDTSTDTLCQTACASMMQFACICTSRGAGSDRWVCASRPITCQ